MKDFPYCVHYELPVAVWTFADFDKKADRRQSIDLVGSDLHDFVEDETSQQRFRTNSHELFVEAKYLPAGCSKTWKFDHLGKVGSVERDAKRLARHLNSGHCLVAACLVVDDDGLFAARYEPESWPPNVELLLANPAELERRGIHEQAAHLERRAD